MKIQGIAACGKEGGVVGGGAVMENRDRECEDEGALNQNQMPAESPVLSQTRTSCSLLAYPSKQTFFPDSHELHGPASLLQALFSRVFARSQLAPASLSSAASSAREMCRRC